MLTDSHPPPPSMSTRRFASVATDLLSRQEDGETAPQMPHHGSPVVAFIIGLAIILLASILNAAGLNLTKLDHVRRFSTISPFLVGSLILKSGANQYDTQGATEEGLVATVMVARDDTLHVRQRGCVSVHSVEHLRRLSQLIGSTLALDYRRAGG